MLTELGAGSVEIVGDDLRAFHPQYEHLLLTDDATAAFYTDRDTGLWIEKSIAYALEKRVSIVIEGTMRDADKVAASMRTLRAAGYRIDARVLAVSERLSQQGIMQRYEAQKAHRGSGRMTTVQAHQAAYDGAPITVERIEQEKLADRMTLYRRAGVVIYANELVAGEWRKEPQARAALEAERNRAMGLDERRQYAKDFDKLVTLILHPERHASAIERKMIAYLQQRAQCELAAGVFREMPAEDALRQHPQLAPAYESLRVIDAKANADGLDATQRAKILAHARERLVQRIAAGEPLGVVIQRSRDRGPER